ncbi:MAG TPA: amidohydrolase family protein [Acidobacteriaceae bacterium]|nr:amidohydrolase family protein [Acidobacteriaceae bacterium]
MIDRRRFLVGAAGALAARAALGERVAARTPMIDAHVHVWEDNPEFPFAAGARPSPKNATPETLLVLMRANDVARTVLVQVIHYKWDNRFLLHTLKKYPGKFQGVCRVNPLDPAAPDELSRLTEEGCRGVRLSPAGTAEGDWIRGPLMLPLWRRCAELKVPMVILAPVTRMPDLVKLVEANPELDVVIDHMADCPVDRPELLQLLLELARYPRVFVKISDLWVVSHDPYPYADAQAMVGRLRDAFGAERLMGDTNWPVSLKQLPYARIVELYREHMTVFTAAEREQVLLKTVQRLWPFGVR